MLLKKTTFEDDKTSQYKEALRALKAMARPQKVFAWLPVTLTDGTIVWLEKYWREWSVKIPLKGVDTVTAQKWLLELKKSGRNSAVWIRTKI